MTMAVIGLSDDMQCLIGIADTINTMWFAQYGQDVVAIDEMDKGDRDGKNPDCRDSACGLRVQSARTALPS